ncbi:MAG: hypothetical protein U9N35_06010 [Euryarchaeota archaeon]|nr:hypothetical protein [Euryarchaeota archaeon]
MEKKIAITFVVMLAVPVVAASVNWVPENDRDIVYEMAKKDNKLVLFYIRDEWTEKMGYVFEDSEVSEYINANFYAIRMYKTTSGEFCERYDVKEAPTVLFLDTYGKEIGRTEGYMDTNKFYNEMKGIIEAKELRKELEDDAYKALTEADSLYDQDKYKECKEQYSVALDKFQQLGNKERMEYCRSRISDADLKVQFDLLKYGLVLFVGIVIFFSLLYYISKR